MPWISSNDQKKRKGLDWFNCRHTKHNKTYNFLLVQSLAIKIQAAQLRCAFCRCWWAIQPVSSRLKFVNIAWEVGRIAEVGRLYGCMRPPLLAASTHFRWYLQLHDMWTHPQQWGSNTLPRSSRLSKLPTPAMAGCHQRRSFLDHLSNRSKKHKINSFDLSKGAISTN